jgi:CRP-like cAMP-binding protein
MNSKFLQSSLHTSLSSTQATLKFPVFAPVVSDAFECLKDLPRPTTFEAKRSLYEQGAEVHTVWLIRSGLVKLRYGTPGGRDTTLGLRSAGWCAGAVWALSGRASIYSVETITTCTASGIPAAEFASRLAQCEKLMQHFVQALCLESISQATSQAQIMSWTAEERLEQCLGERERTAPGVKTVDIFSVLKQAELAHLLSITPEHLSRLMHRSSPAQKRRQLMVKSA